MGINVDNYYQSKSNSLKAADIPPGKQIKLMIESCEEVTFKEDDGTEKLKLRLGFVGKEKGLILNKTNAMTISYVYGPDVDGWLRREILLFSTKVDFGGKMVDALRVDIPRQTVEYARQEPVHQPAPQQARPQQAAPQQASQQETPPYTPGSDDNFDDDIPF